MVYSRKRESMASLSEDALTEHNEITRKGTQSDSDTTEEPAKKDSKSHEESVQQTEDGTTASVSLLGKGGNPSLRSITMIKKKVSQWKGRQGSISIGSANPRGLPTQVNLENTYKILPDEGTKFSVTKVKEVATESINFMLAKQGRYNPEKAMQVSKLLADDIKSRVKKLGYIRYKFVVVVNIGETSRQGMEVTSRAVWDTRNDNCATVVHRFANMFVVATVYGTYFE